MKKNFLIVTGLLMSLSLSGCDLINSFTPNMGSSTEEKSEPKSSSEKETSSISETQTSQETSKEESNIDPVSYDPDDQHDNDGNLWVIQGENMLSDGTLNTWDNQRDKELIFKNTMYRIGLADLYNLDENMGSILERRTFRYIYRFDGLVLGGRMGVEWEQTEPFADHTEIINGAYCFKFTKCSYNEEEDYYFVNQWIPDEYYYECENLSPDILSCYQSNNNFNPHPYESGVFTVIATEFTDGNFGLGLIKTGEWNYSAPYIIEN